jgi:NAD(P)H-hydrate epimerase
VAADPARPTEAVGLELPAAGWSEAALEAAGRGHAMVVGPGLGAAATTQTAIRDVLVATQLPVVVDGDALTALGADAGRILQGREASTVLTPHDAEFERLAGAKPSADRLYAARSLAASVGAVVLLKGPTTVVAGPDGAALVVVDGDARLATAGTGDVLSGVIGALLARGVSPFEAAAGGAWLHARAALEGPADGLVASDLIDALPLVLEGLHR